MVLCDRVRITLSCVLGRGCLQDTWAKYLKEGMNVNLLTWNGKARGWRGLI